MNLPSPIQISHFEIYLLVWASLNNSHVFISSKGTPFISPLIQWDHRKQFNVPSAEDFLPGGGKGQGCVVEIDIG